MLHCGGVRCYWRACFGFPQRVINLVSYVSGIPASYGIASTIDIGTAGRLTSLGLPPNFPATYLIILDTATLAIFGFVSLFIFKRRSDEPIAMVASSMLIFTAMLYTAPGYEARAPMFMVAAGAALGQTLQVAFLLMFPDGRFWPRWSWILLAPLLLWRFLMWYFVYLPHPLGVMRRGETYSDSPPNTVDLSLMMLDLRLRHLGTDPALSPSFIKHPAPADEVAGMGYDNDSADRCRLLSGSYSLFLLSRSTGMTP